MPDRDRLLVFFVAALGLLALAVLVTLLARADAGTVVFKA